MNILKNVLKITLAIFVFSNFAFAQTTQNFQDIGACWASMAVKFSRKIPITEGMMEFANKYTPTYQRAADVLKNKCNGLSEGATVSCMQKNGLSANDINFFVGASRNFTFIDSPQDPKRLPNIEVASSSCTGLIKFM